MTKQMPLFGDSSLVAPRPGNAQENDVPKPACPLASHEPSDCGTESHQSERNSEHAWEKVLAHVRVNLNPTSFQNWFGPTRYLATRGRVLHVQVPNQVFTEWLSSQYSELLTQALQATDNPATRVEFVPREQVNELPAGDTDGASPQWPTLASQALHGLPGRIVKALEPHTEADPVALLIHVLAVAGTLLGRGPHFVAEASHHFTNLYAVLVGQSSKGRKGSAWARVRRLFEPLDSFELQRHVKSGLTSGEGLIWAVRDPVEKSEPIREGGRVVDYQTVVADPGVADKRLLVVEEEFASVLQAMARGGNTLSAQVRTAWDTGNIRVLAKNCSTQATGAHISILGHITRTELRRNLGNTEVANGFANRFLWLAVRRSKLLPDGGHPDSGLIQELARQLAATLEQAGSVTAIARDRKAHVLWCEAYPGLSGENPGLLGCVTSRAEAQVMRLACLYALLDGSSIIRPQHLQAALALWRYAEASARWIFADLTGNPLQDELLALLRQTSGGLTRTEIRDHFGRHRSNDVSQSLHCLEQEGLARREREPTSGRPVDRWFATTPSIPATRSD